ncbi:MAG TPA: hypothetical protein VN690_03985 [Terriglobales bacterium]|nr:hypothetical protein [Terriglobales bacterium]
MKAAATRARNKAYYRILHVPLWIWVFFTLPGALTASLYAHGFGRAQWLWLGIVAAVCVWRGVLGRLPGAEPRPYITHYGLNWPNLGYRVVCYTAAWIAIVAPWMLNAVGLIYAAAGGSWIVARLYGWPYDLIAAVIVAIAAIDRLPRVRRSIRGEGAERAWFYVGVWTAVISQLAAWGLWRLAPRLGFAGVSLMWLRLAGFLSVSAGVLALGLAGILPRTQRYYIAEGETDLPVAAGE